MCFWNTMSELVSPWNSVFLTWSTLWLFCTIINQLEFLFMYCYTHIYTPMFGWIIISNISKISDFFPFQKQHIFPFSLNIGSFTWVGKCKFQVILYTQSYTFRCPDSWYNTNRVIWCPTCRMRNSQAGFLLWFSSQNIVLQGRKGAIWIFFFILGKLFMQRNVV